MIWICIFDAQTHFTHYRWEVLKYILLGKFLSTQREPVINISWELNICFPTDQHFQYLLQLYSWAVSYQVWLLEERRFYLQVRLWNEGLFAARQIWNCWSTLCHSKALASSLSLSAMWANYCSFEKLYCIKIWQPIQTNVIYKILYFKQLVRNGYTEVGTCKPLMDYKWQRWRSRKRADLQGWQTRFLYHSSVFQNFRHIFDFAFPDMIWGGYGGLWIHFFHKLFQERGVGHLFCNLFYLIYLIVHSLY